MQVIIDDADYLELLTNNGGTKKESGGEYSPFTGKRCQTVSMDVVKKLVSLPKEEREKMLLGLSNNSSYT